MILLVRWRTHFCHQIARKFVWRANKIVYKIVFLSFVCKNIKIGAESSGFTTVWTYFAAIPSTMEKSGTENILDTFLYGMNDHPLGNDRYCICITSFA